MSLDPSIDPNAAASPPPVCVCGYDLAGLPPDGAAKCPECGLVIALIEPPVPRFHHWGRLLAAGMTPAYCAFVAIAIDFFVPSSAAAADLVDAIGVFAAAAWLLVSVPAFLFMLVRAMRVRSMLAGAALLGLAVPLSLLANIACMLVFGLFFT